MSQREHAEDTIFWSLKSSTQFAARRRTIQLFFASPKPSTPSSYTWIDNTPLVWEELLSVLEIQNPKTIAINVDSDIAFSGGLHAGEIQEIIARLGLKWAKRFVPKPIVGVEFVATMVKDQLQWYKKLQETAWAIISEAFSERAIVPGKTSTEVRFKLVELFINVNGVRMSNGGSAKRSKSRIIPRGSTQMLRSYDPEDGTSLEKRQLILFNTAIFSTLILALLH